MKNKINLLLLSLWLSSSMVASAESKSGLVIEKEGVVVTIEDIERYIFDNTPEKDRSAILNRTGIFKEIAENIYLIRRLGSEAKKNESLDWAQIEWANKFSEDRKRMSALLQHLTKQQVESFDWKGLAKENYLVEGEKYQLPEQVNVSHVLITLDSRTDEEAKILATEVREKALTGEDFTTLAKQFSEDPSVENNEGNLGMFSRGQMVPDFEKAAFAMTTAGEISEIIKSKFGYHVIQFHKRVASKKQSFEQVQAKIISELQKSRVNEVRQDILTAFRSEQEVDEEKLQQLRDKYKVTVPVLE